MSTNRYRVIISGASSGIGKHCAKELAKHGCELVLLGRNQDRLTEVAQECGDSGALVLPIAGDLNVHEQMLQIVQTALGMPGTYTPVLVNSIGIAEFGPFEENDYEGIQRQIQTNLITPIALIHAVLPHMLKGGAGKIVNITSIAGKHVFPGTSLYAASKAGLQMFTKTLHSEVRTKNIRVVDVCPGAVDTEIWDHLSSHPAREDMVKPEDIAAWVSKIVLDESTAYVDEIVLMPPKGIL